VAAIKGRRDMAQVVRRAVEERQRLPRRDIRLGVLGRDLVLRRSDVAAARDAARATGQPHNRARRVFVRQLIDGLAKQYAAQEVDAAAARGSDRAGWSAGDTPIPVDSLGEGTGGLLGAADMDEVRQDLRAARDVRVAINLCWMPMTPTLLIEDLYAKPHIMVYCAPQLTAAERAALARPAGSAWTASDIPLLDEAAELLGEDDAAQEAELRHAALRRAEEIKYAKHVLAGGVGAGLVSAEQLADRFAATGPSLTLAERAGADRSWTYGHIVVDEAQELTPMDWRALLRRCPTRSLTIVGDAGQTRAPGATGRWDASLNRALGKGAWRLEELTVNYRTPGAVVRAAQRRARAAGLPVGADTAAREVRGASQERVVDDLVGEAVALAASLLPEDATGRVALIAAGPTLDAARAAVAAGPLKDAVARSGESPLDFPLAILDAGATKGLEFDEVIIADPDAILRAAGTETVYDRRAGAADLYVAMTRPTRRLWILKPAARA
jgi:hypothetical protein